MSKIFTETDKQAAKLIGTLLHLAKVSEGVRRVMGSGEGAKTVSDGIYGLLRTVDALFPGEAELEQETISFAKKLGFEIDQQMIPEGAKTKQ